MADLNLYLWRAKWIMLAVFLSLSAIGLYGASLAPDTVKSKARLILNDPQSQTSVTKEYAYLRSDETVLEALSRFPVKRIYPDLKAHGPISVRRVQSNLKLVTKHANGAFEISFEHSKPDVSEEVLTAIIATYLTRFDAGDEGTPDPDSTKIDDLKSQILEKNEEISRFLATNDVGNYEAEISSSRGLILSLDSEVLKTEAQLRAVRVELSTARQQLVNTPEIIDLSNEDTTQKLLIDLELEREDLLARYTEQSQAVKSIDERIKRVRNYIEDGQQIAGSVRTGPSPLYMDVKSNIYQLEAEQDALEEQLSALRGKLAPIQNRLAVLGGLSGEWSALQSRLDQLQTKLKDEIGRLGTPSIPTPSVNLVSPAKQVSTMSRSKTWITLASLLLAGLAAIMVGLIYALTRKGIASPNRLRRETGLTVLSGVREKR